MTADEIRADAIATAERQIELLQEDYDRFTRNLQALKDYVEKSLDLPAPPDDPLQNTLATIAAIRAAVSQPPKLTVIVGGKDSDNG